MRQVFVVCGPTASGKSSYALRLAQRIGGVIINADALQVYKQLKIITCCPAEEELNIAQHFLYNHIDVTEEYNAYKYVQQVVKVLDLLVSDKPIIIVGGTGMYLKFLLSGVHKMPEIDTSLRVDLRNKKSAELYKELQNVDPAVAASLNQFDIKRVARALEIFLQTGKSIMHFYTDDNLYKPLEGYTTKIYLLLPERNLLYQNCNERFEKLVKQGAIEEAENILPIWNSLQPSAQKALGLQELINYLKGYISLDYAINTAQRKTRNFAKRQITWFKHQMKADYIIG